MRWMTLSKDSRAGQEARRDLRVGGENAEIFALDAYHYCCSDHTAAHRARLCDPLVSQHLHWEWALANRSVRVSTRTSSPNKLLSVALLVRFATDSPLEGAGFEPSVPVGRRTRI